ncbi:MAG TPA: pantoate--beta-alanine ligase [Longimicrobiaceae bacterium]|nr:pantoate--beta-alanine ligase [Longimicrobiaceae bacterium]
MSELRVIRTKQEVREEVAAARAAGERVALVPTMGYLHEGHLSLLDRAREHAGCVALSLFINPLQFGRGEDLDRYPRDLERDVALAARRGADLLFAPSVAEMYPHGEPSVAVVPERGADRLCGASRPGHFRGVLTVVAKLFGIFTPDVALFGQKDYQQATLIRRMVEELEMPLRIEVGPIVREEGGLAMSSRNSYLSVEERERALSLWSALQQAQALFAAGESDAEVLRAAMQSTLAAGGAEIEYAEVVDPETLDSPARARPGAVCLLAARVGSTRLIDNHILER